MSAVTPQADVYTSTDEEIISKALTLPGPFIHMTTLKQKSSKKMRSSVISETFNRCIDKMVSMGMGIRHEASERRINGHPLLLQV